MSSTDRSLLRALRTCLNPTEGLLSAMNEWEDVAATAADSFLSFQVLQSLGHAAQPFPTGMAGELRTRVRNTSARNAVHLHRLEQLVENCRREQIPVMLTKGLWLVHCIYQDVAARESGDIDLLLRPGDMKRFTQVARGLGYEVPPENALLMADARSTNEFTLRHSDDGVAVDVHWSITNPATEAPIDEDMLWARSVVADVGGVQVRTPNLEDHLLYLCFHAAVHHRFCDVGLRCLYDVAMVIRQPPRPIRWDELTARAHVLGWERAAWLMFALVDEHLGVQVPAGAMDALHASSREDRQVRQLAMDAIFAREENSLYRLVARALAPQPAGRLTAVRQLLFPAPGQMRNQFDAPAGTPTWRLHAKRWSLKLREWAPEVAALLLGSRAHRDGLARTVQIERWLASRS